ncbi:MAG: DUF2339 domain-containing protein [Robiginitalea sp.]
MDLESDQIKKLKERLEMLSQRQESYAKEIRELREELAAFLKAKEASLQGPVGEDRELPPEKVQNKAAGAQESALRRTPARKSKFCRNTQNGVIAGVCSGLADYLQINRVLIRVLFVLFSFLACTGLAAYLLLWIIMPASSGGQPKSVPSHPAAAPKVPEEESPQYQAPGFEKFVGENLLGKVGIVILILGVSIGAKYSIDNNLISPLVRIILGYLVGAGLFFIGLRLRPRYENFSAVLLSGAMTILYFMTFAAYTFYGMYPQWLAFLLMVLITVGTVGVSLQYNRQIIAVIGLVGAYCIPILLSEGKDQAAILFTYIGIINLGILYIAFRKYWKPLHLSAFAITWLIFLSWYLSAFSGDNHTILCWGFLIFFFLLFYATSLAYKLLRKEAFNYMDVILLLLNGFIFYGLGYNLLETSPGSDGFLGVFTFLNACIHAVIAILIHRRKGADHNIFLLVSGLALVFLTITIPVQLDGNWVTLLWMAEAVMLFWIGRTRKVGLYENLAYLLILLGVLSLAEDWAAAPNNFLEPGALEGHLAFFNVDFLTSLLTSFALGYITYLFFKEPRFLKWTQEPLFGQTLSYAVPGLFLLVLYGSFAIEISNYWERTLAGLILADPYQPPSPDATGTYRYVQLLKQVWLLNYSLVFISILGLLNWYKLKFRSLGLTFLLLSLLVWFTFMTTGLYQLSELRDYYLDGSSVNGLGWPIGLRYLSLLLLALLLTVSHKLLRQAYLNLHVPLVSDSILALTVGWAATSELLHWLALSQVANSYKLWVSVFWGLYALVLVVFGLWRQKRHLRFGGIALFFFTLLKVFFFDLTYLNTLSKTIVFISLGIFLLIVSYLYQRFKAALSEEDPE